MPDSTSPFALDITIDRESKTPLHTQISEPLAALILDGTLPAGSRLEDELSMAKRLMSPAPRHARPFSTWWTAAWSSAVGVWARSSRPCTSTDRCS